MTESALLKRPIALTIPVTQEGWITRLTLAAPCRHCDSVGMIRNPAWAAWNGEVPYPEGPEEIPCPECDGVGLTLTEAGLAILQLLATWRPGGAR